MLLSVCLHVISASFDYIYEEHSFMGKTTSDVKRSVTSWLYDNVRHFKITFSQLKESFTNIRRPWMKNSFRINLQFKVSLLFWASTRKMMSCNTASGHWAVLDQS